MVRLVVLLVRPRPGEVDTGIAGPADDGLVEEFGTVIKVHTAYCISDFSDSSLECFPYVGAGVITDRTGEHPSGVHVGQIQGAGELPFEGGAAVRNGITLEEPRLCGDLIPSFADLDRIAQQW